VNLEREMARAGLTINELARKSGVHHVMIRGYLSESDRGKLPSIETLVMPQPLTANVNP
jgi:transcriptional regulator with XRE-family HTH domain